MPNGTISLIQPEMIRTVLGFDSQNVTFCFEAQRSQLDVINLVSAECMPRINPLVQAFISRNATLNVSERNALKKRESQLFDFMSEDGETYKSYGDRPEQRADVLINTHTHAHAHTVTERVSGRT